MAHRIGNELTGEYFKEDGQWFKCSRFFLAPIKWPEDNVPREYIVAEGQKRLISSFKSNPKQMKSTSNQEEDDEIVWLPNFSLDMYSQSSKKRSAEGDSGHATKCFKSEQVDSCSNGHSKDSFSLPNTVPKKTSKKSLETFTSRIKEHWQILAFMMKRSTKLENSGETVQLAKYRENERAIKGKIAVVEPSMRNYGRKSGFPKPGSKLVGDLSDSDDSDHISDERKIYLDAAGNCVYCYIHSASPHDLTDDCPHIDCKCAECFGLDLARPKSPYSRKMCMEKSGRI